ncbi:MAG: hypothetical protein OEV79_07610 [candidate division WOR-3 bacterium]|nr:hypothetical protein [candidate division WOR-3 bacterium]
MTENRTPQIVAFVSPVNIDNFAIIVNPAIFVSIAETTIIDSRHLIFHSFTPQTERGYYLSAFETYGQQDLNSDAALSSSESSYRNANFTRVALMDSTEVTEVTIITI